MYVTPGPNNSILTASGIKFGFARSIPNILGIPSGHGLQLALVCLGLGTLFITYPILYDILRYVGSAYILYLAYKMFGSLNITKTEDRSRPLKYYEAILFQFVNPKAWVICSTAVTLYYPKGENILIGTLFMVIMSTVCLLYTSDAADDLTRVDLGGRRIIKKNSRMDFSYSSNSNCCVCFFI